MATKVRVKRVELQKIVEGRMRKAENEYRRAVEAFPKRVEDWQASCVTQLQRAAKDAVEKGKLPRYDTRYDGHYGIHLPQRPSKPSEGRELCNLRRMFTTLKIGSEETVLLSQEDADFYFGPCVL